MKSAIEKTVKKKKRDTQSENGKSQLANSKSKGDKRKAKSRLAEGQVLTGQKAAAAYAGVSVRTIRYWKAAGMPVAEGGGYIKGMLDFYKKNEGLQPTEEKKAALSADADYKTTRARLLAMELDLKQGKLLAADEIKAGRVARILTVKRALLGLGRKLAPQLAKITDEKRIAAVINNECRNIIKGFSG